MKELEKILEEIEQAKREPWYRLSNYDVKHKLDGAINRIVDIIRKHINDGWIPVEERLPEENQEVWITTKYGEVKRAMYTEHLGNNEVKIFLLIGGSENIDEISAWQPYYVPEPYMPEND